MNNRMSVAIAVLVSMTAMIILLSSSRILAADEAWPRDFINSDGTRTTIAGKPKRILSTSVTLTGTLLAINAPVVASGSAANGEFFRQWDSVAKERSVLNAWPAGSVDIETVYALQPDLIVVSASGAASEKNQIEVFQKIAPTILLDDGALTWQDLAMKLSAATGDEQNASDAITAFNSYVEDAKRKISPPPGKTNIISFNGGGQPNPIAKIGGPHASLLAQLGFDIEDPNPAWHTQATTRSDFVWAPYENLVDLKSETTFLLRVNDSKVKAFTDDHILQNLPSVRSNQVYGLGENSFRIDYFSAREIVDGIVAKFHRQ